jgi:primosomal protein N' (replication factor Y)
VLGVVWRAGRGDFDYKDAQSVIRVFDVAPMADEMRQFLIKAADYTLTPMNAMLRLATRAPGLGDAPSMRKVYRLGTDEPTRMTDARQSSWGIAYGGLAFTLKRSRSAGVTTSVVKGLASNWARSAKRARCRHHG